MLTLNGRALVAWLTVAIAAVTSAQPVLADARIGKFTVTFAEGLFHRNGDFTIPGAVSGVSPDGDFKADRAFGNLQRQDVTLVGRVLIHQRVGQASSPPMTLTANQVRVVSKPSSYTATGSVVVVQQDRTLKADFLQLNNVTHQGVAQGNVSAQQGDRVVQSELVNYNTLSGAINVPGQLTGFSSDTDFRADRGFGNQKAGTFTLIGNVIIHRFGSATTNGSSEPITLWCDKLDTVRRPQTVYTATGHVKVAQGDRTLVAPKLTLNDTTHVATMTGGVHGEEPPDRTFDSAELLYNTQTQDFKALGGVRATFPFRRAQFASPTPTAHVSASPSGLGSAPPSPHASASPSPLSTPTATTQPSPTP